jgi:hypothetical protein
MDIERYQIEDFVLANPSLREDAPCRKSTLTIGCVALPGDS